MTGPESAGVIVRRAPCPCWDPTVHSCDEVALLRGVGYGATRRTRQVWCGRCGYVDEIVVEAVSPR